MTQISNNSNIFFTIIIMFGVSFSIFFAFMSIFGAEVEKNKSQTEFYFNVLNSEEQKILLLGNSQMASVNATKIEKQLLKNNNDFSVLNLVIAADRPRLRQTSLDDMISLNPHLVVYGIGFFDFENTKRPLFDKPKSFLPDPQQFLDELFIQNSDLNFNTINSPKLVTLNILRDLISEKSEDEQLYYDSNTPFFGYDLIKKNQIRNNKELVNNLHEIIFYGIKPPQENPDVKAFKKIIDKFQENNIQVAVIISPFNKYYIENMPYYYEDRLESIIKEIKSETGIHIYSLLHKYKDLNIWSDLNHISINSSVPNFNDDVLTILLNELD